MDISPLIRSSVFFCLGSYSYSSIYHALVHGIITYLPEICIFFGDTEIVASNTVRAINNIMPEKLLDRFIKWPEEDEARQISRMFEETHNFPREIGFIDGTHIPIRKPSKRGQDYYNRKDFHSIQLQDKSFSS